MGLDIVELVMGVEEAFGVEIPDEKASELTTSRKLIDYLDARLATDDSKPCLTQRSFYRLRRAAREVVNADAVALTPAMPLEILIPMEDRRQKWRAFELALSLPLPGLQRSTPLWLCGALLVLTGTAIAVAVSNVWLGAGAFGLSLAAFLATTQRYRLHFRVPTFGELARVIAVHHARELVAADERWSRRQIEEVVIGLVREVTALPEIDLDAHFVRDLHLD